MLVKSGKNKLAVRVLKKQIPPNLSYNEIQSPPSSYCTGRHKDKLFPKINKSVNILMSRPQSAMT